MHTMEIIEEIKRTYRWNEILRLAPIQALLDAILFKSLDLKARGELLQVGGYGWQENNLEEGYYDDKGNRIVVVPSGSRRKKS